MIKRPVRYDVQDMSLQDASFQVFAHPFRKIGLPDKEFHEIGKEIADCINGATIAPPSNPLPDALPEAKTSVSTGDLNGLRDKLGKSDLRKLVTLEKRLNRFNEKMTEKYAEGE